MTGNILSQLRLIYVIVLWGMYLNYRLLFLYMISLKIEPLVSVIRRHEIQTSDRHRGQTGSILNDNISYDWWPLLVNCDLNVRLSAYIV